MNFNPMTWDAPYLVIVGALFVIVFCRANGTYWLGRLISRGAERTRARAMMDSPGYQRAVQRLNQWGPPVVSVSFLTIGFQTLVNLAAGATRMPLTRYLPAVTVGCVMWAFFYGTVGSAGIEALGLVWSRNPALAVFLGVLAVSALVVFIVWRVREAKRRRPEPVA
ncbi:MAG: VTT domain-containing protein [Propionibacteriaceae bacterium]|nr:VTT domain-containing protein [Propionibacteriaceae bacterium]